MWLGPLYLWAVISMSIKQIKTKVKKTKEHNSNLTIIEKIYILYMFNITAYTAIRLRLKVAPYKILFDLTFCI